MDFADCEDFVINCTDRRFTDIAGIYKSTTANLHTTYHMQIGSYTCGNYFLGLLHWLKQNLLPVDPAEYDIVIPVFSESQLEQFRSHMMDTVVQEARYIVVNDWGMLRCFSGRQRVRLGRLLFRDYRDHRYPAYEENHAYQAKAGTLLAALQNMEYEIAAAENDLITLNYQTDLESVDIYYHFPYRQISSAHICEFAAIGKPVEKKFIPDDDCSFQCFDVKIHHESGYLKIGRNIFDVLGKDWLPTVPKLRLIYTPGW